MQQTASGRFVKDATLGENEGNRIAEAVVFTDQAYLKRQVKTRAETGLNRFLVEVQAFTVDGDSAAATVYGQGEILGVQYREIPVRKAQQAEVGALEEEQRELERQQKTLAREREALAKQQRFLDSIIGFADTEIPKKLKTEFPSTDNLQTVLVFLDKNMQRFAAAEKALDLRAEALAEQLAVVQRKLKRLQGPTEATHKAVEVLFDSSEDQEIGIEVSYVARNASWKPVYKIDVPLDLSGASLTLFAHIEQKTGEHWRDVALTVSNAVPLKGAALPEAQSWRLSLAPPLPVAAAVADGVMLAGEPTRGRKKRTAKEPKAAEEFLELAAAQPAAGFSRAEQHALPHFFEYRLAQPITLDSGGGETLLPLYSKNPSAEFFAYAAPRQDPLAYLVCRTAPDSELLAGKLNIHFGGRFVAASALSEKKPGEDLLIPLGAERGLRVRREQLTDKLTETFFGMVDRSSVARELAFRTVVENLKNEAVRVRLFDSIPVSDTDRIQIKGVATTPEPTVRDWQQHEGVMCWDFELAPGATKEIGIEFHLKHPKNQPPYGL